VSARGKGLAVVTRYLRILSGGSQPILAEASDGYIYVVKLGNNPQGPNLLFNESAGTEVYRACGLSVPSWKPLLVSDSFIDDNPRCWFCTGKGDRIRPERGLCFGSRYLGGDGRTLRQGLPGNYFKRVGNRNSFWLAWMVDTCAGHADNRQAVFLEDAKRRLTAFFVDQGHLFGGTDGKEWRHFSAGCYLDARIYGDLSSRQSLRMLRVAEALDVDRLWRRVQQVTGDWKTPSGVARFEEFLGRISDSGFLRDLVDTMTDPCQIEMRQRERTPDVERKPAILRFGIQAAQLGHRHIGGANCCIACP